MGRPVHLDPRLVLLVATGGTLGTAARYLLTTNLPPQDRWPVATLVENIVGAFLLGLLLEVLVRRGDETPGARRLRLSLGTGLLGGFTTFSSLAIESERLLADAAVGQALAYVVATLVFGFAACFGGVVLAALHHRWRLGRLPDDPDGTERDSRSRDGHDAARSGGDPEIRRPPAVTS